MTIGDLSGLVNEKVRIKSRLRLHIMNMIALKRCDMLEEYRQEREWGKVWLIRPLQAICNMLNNYGYEELKK